MGIEAASTALSSSVLYQRRYNVHEQSGLQFTSVEASNYTWIGFVLVGVTLDSMYLHLWAPGECLLLSVSSKDNEHGNIIQAYHFINYNKRAHSAAGCFNDASAKQPLSREQRKRSRTGKEALQCHPSSSIISLHHKRISNRTWKVSECCGC
jgi:hypothetical protein